MKKENKMKDEQNQEDCSFAKTMTTISQVVMAIALLLVFCCFVVFATRWWDQHNTNEELKIEYPFALSNGDRLSFEPLEEKFLESFYESLSPLEKESDFPEDYFLKLLLRHAENFFKNHPSQNNLRLRVVTKDKSWENRIATIVFSEKGTTIILSKE